MLFWQGDVRHKNEPHVWSRRRWILRYWCQSKWSSILITSLTYSRDSHVMLGSILPTFMCLLLERPYVNYHAAQLPGRGRSWIAGPAGISRLGPNSEPRGNNRSFSETRERARAPVKKIGSSDSIFGLVNSTYFFKITNHNQHAFNIQYIANLIKKYWTCFRCQKLADFLVCFPPSVRVQVRQPPILENLLEDQT